MFHTCVESNGAPNVDNRDDIYNYDTIHVALGLFCHVSLDESVCFANRWWIISPAHAIGNSWQNVDMFIGLDRRQWPETSCYKSVQWSIPSHFINLENSICFQLTVGCCMCNEIASCVYKNTVTIIACVELLHIALNLISKHNVQWANNYNAIEQLICNLNHGT